MLALDLEQYDYSKGSASLIRATEGTILERIPPRVRIRSGAPLELPHILVLIDDPERTVIEPLVAARERLRKLYDFDLMLGSGHLNGYLVDDVGLEQRALDALGKLAEPATFAMKYDVAPDTPVMVYAMGDGNHSLATAKAIWEQIKATVGPDHPARYALVEIENIHDAGLVFEPIHRVLFDVETRFRQGAGGALRRTVLSGAVRLARSHDHSRGGQAKRAGAHAFGVVTAAGFSVAYVPDPPSNLAVGTLQSFLDAWGKAGGFGKIDYVHGEDVDGAPGLAGGQRRPLPAGHLQERRSSRP